MPKQLSSIFRRLGNSIRSFSIAQKTIAIIGVAVLALGGVALASWASTPTYTPLFSGLAAADASAVVDQLNTDGVKYQLTDGGSTILVPQDKVYDERLKAASAGLPTSSTSGYALLDKMGVTSSEFQQDVTYKRALEQELANTISAMKGVKTASVKLAIPKDTVFVSTKQDPTASVFIETQQGATLSGDQVDAIIHLTSASIEGMKATDVSVVDSNGNVLSTVGGGAAGTGDKLSGQYEQKTQNAIQAMLDKIVGPGNSTVAVSAKISNETAQRITEQYTQPTNAPATSESTKKETYAGTGGTTAGVLGPDNIAVPNGGTGNGSYTSEDTTKNNAVDKVTETRDIPAGAVDRQTVSVAINSAAKGVNKAEIQNLVQSAAGFNQQRGDVVTVETVGFSSDAAKQAQAALQAEKDAQAQDQLNSLIRTGIIAAAIAAAAIIVIILVARRRKQAAEPLDIAELIAENENTDPLAGILSTPALPEPETVPLTPIEPTSGDQKRKELAGIATRDPQKAAEMLRSLMDGNQN